MFFEVVDMRDTCSSFLEHMLLLCPKCDTRLKKCKGGESTLQYREAIYRCNGCGTYYLYNLEGEKLTVYDLEARVEEDIFKVVEKTVERNLIGRRLKPSTGSRKC